MKTWEVYKMALENPKAKFRSLAEGLDQGKIFKVSKSGVLVNDVMNGVGLCIPAVGSEWALIREPVDFMTAIKAYRDGRTITCEYTGFSKTRKYDPSISGVLKDDRNIGLSCQEILDGKWYIED